MTDTKLLNGQVALVTGATSGLGWQFAQTLAAAGATVAISGRRVEKLKDLESLITKNGGKAAAYRLDMTDAVAIEKTVSQISTEIDPINILINNAGIANSELATRVPIDEIDQMLSVNLRGPFIAAREVAKHLIKIKQPGRIVNISSISAYHYIGHGAAMYSVTKAAIARMTEVLATEWAKFHINVNALGPDFFKSEITNDMSDNMGEFWAKYPRARLCDPALLDSTLLYLCSPASEAVTGTVIKIDDAQLKR